jgi:hypothetical protein
MIEQAQPGETVKTKKTPKTKTPAEIASPPAKAEEPQKRAAHHHVLDRMVRVMRARGADYPTDAEQDFGVKMLANLKPDGPAQVMLCAQMVATWEVGMAMLTASKQSTDFQSLEAQGNLAVKLLSIFERQFSALERARRPPQTVVVKHEHRHIHVGGQVPGETGEATIIEGQAYAPTDPRALAIAPSPALLGQDPPRDALPVACDEARPLPNARRRTRDRSSER